MFSNFFGTDVLASPRLLALDSPGYPYYPEIQGTDGHRQNYKRETINF